MVRAAILDRFLERNQALRFAVDDLEHVTTLLAYLASVSATRRAKVLTELCQGWERKMRRHVDRRPQGRRRARLGPRRRDRAARSVAGRQGGARLRGRGRHRRRGVRPAGRSGRRRPRRSRKGGIVRAPRPLPPRARAPRGPAGPRRSSTPRRAGAVGSARRAAPRSPASTAWRIARAIRSGSAARETALASSTPSQPSSIASVASDAVPIPASRITGTSACSTMIRRL